MVANHYTGMHRGSSLIILVINLIYVLFLNHNSSRILGKPLFPGTSTINQIEKIVTTIALPTQKDVKVMFAYVDLLLFFKHKLFNIGLT